MAAVAAAVAAAVQEIFSLADGRSYEVETMVNGKHWDFLVDVKGTVREVEDETWIDSIPAAAKAAIEKKAGERREDAFG